MRTRSLRTGAVWPAALLALVDCSVLRPGPPAGPDPEAALVSLLSEWPVAAGDTVAIAGFRLGDGKASAQTQALDEVLLSAAVRVGVPVRVDAGVASRPTAGELPWEPEGLLPRDWRDLPGPLVAGGQVFVEPPWVYLRLVLADERSGEVRRDAATRIGAGSLARLVAEGQQRRAGAGPEPATALEIDLHVIVRRDDGGFPRRVDLVDQGSLDQGDRLQLRFRAAEDCEVYAFLYRSDGQRVDLFAEGAVYGGRWLYAPGENGWVTLDQSDVAYTLYFLAAPRIEADRAALWEEVDRLQQQGRIERLRGLDLVDEAVGRFLARTSTGLDSLALSRGAEGIERGPVERIVYSDGAAFDSRPERLRGALIARAYSAQVQYR